jgi:hypothetical protein
MRIHQWGALQTPREEVATQVPLHAYLSDIQDSIANTWRITPEVVAQYQDIENSELHTIICGSRHTGIQPRNGCNFDTASSGEEVEMAMWDWQDDWKIPVITKEVPTRKGGRSRGI